MEIQPASHLQYSPFPRNSVNVIVGPTHIGKTYFVTKLISNYKLFFAPPVKRILIVLCNVRVQPIEFDRELDVPVEQIPLSEFVPDNLEPHDLVVLDDLQVLSEPIRLTITVCAHHYNLAALFVITHSVLGNANFELLNYCHRLFSFMGASANVRQIKYIINSYYHDTEIKQYLKSVCSFCEKTKEVLALELNPLANNNAQRQVVLAFSHLTSLLDKGYFLLYPYPHWGKEYSKTFKGSVTTKMSDSFTMTDDSFQYPDPMLVAVPVNTVLQAKTVLVADKKERQCSDQKQWEETIREIEDNIESYFPPARWQKIKNLAKEILRNSQFCVKTDGKTFHLKERPRTEVSMIDFLAVATRRAGPIETRRDPMWKIYSLHVDTLLKNNAPKDLFKNKLLVPARFQ
jgi:hypothetical protein